jgi:hypothetical protein
MYVVDSYLAISCRQWVNISICWPSTVVLENSTSQSPYDSCRTGQSPAGILRTPAGLQAKVLILVPVLVSSAELGRTGTELSRTGTELSRNGTELGRILLN